MLGTHTQWRGSTRWLSLLPLFSLSRAGGTGKVGVYLCKLQFTMETRALRDMNNAESVRKSKPLQRKTAQMPMNSRWGRKE